MLLDIYDSKKINLVSIFFILCCFPWVSFSTNELDSQPWVILLGSAVLLIDKNKKIPKYMLTAFILTIFGLVLSIYKTMTSAPAALDMTSWIIRSIANYGTFYVVLIISWNAFSRGYDKLKLIKIVKLSNYIYYLFAIIEINSPTIIEFLGNSRPSGGRGLTSLTPEPTFFAIFIIFSSLLIFAARGFSFKEDRITHFLNIFGNL